MLAYGLSSTDFFSHQLTVSLLLGWFNGNKTSLFYPAEEICNSDRGVRQPENCEVCVEPCNDVADGSPLAKYPVCMRKKDKDGEVEFVTECRSLFEVQDERSFWSGCGCCPDDDDYDYCDGSYFPSSGFVH